jgi:hypothetical protein
MASRSPQGPFVIEVVFEERDDGGLIAKCDKVPNFYLSHQDASLVIKDVQPALEAILSDMFGLPIRVTRLPDIDEALRRQPSFTPPLFHDAKYYGMAEAA